MSTLERRLARLEKAAHPDADPLEVIVVRGMPTVGETTVRASFGNTSVDRRTDESEDDFVERATAEALIATGQRPCMLFLFAEDVLQ
jgi:hypothetical protein